MQMFLNSYYDTDIDQYIKKFAIDGVEIRDAKYERGCGFIEIVAQSVVINNLKVENIGNYEVKNELNWMIPALMPT